MDSYTLKPSFGETFFRAFAIPIMRQIWTIELAQSTRYLELERPCFVYGNHSHNYDPFILNMFTPWLEYTTGVLTKEYFRGRLMRKIMTDIHLLPTRKHVPEPHLIRELYRMLDAGHAIVIYPEGGRRWDGRPAPWIESTAKIFVRSGVPIYPVVTRGSYTAWPRWATYPRRSRIEVDLQEPLRFDKKTPVAEALPLLKAPIDIDENDPPDRVRPYAAYKPAQGIHRLLYRDPVSGANGGVFTRDGTYVENAAGTFRYKMLPDSSMIDEASGERFTPGALFDRVRALPLERDAAGAYISDTVRMHTEETFPTLHDHGDVRASLFPDEIRIEGRHLKMAIPLEDVRYTGTERSTKLQITMDGQMVQFTFHRDGSPLHWDHTIQRIKEAAAAVDRPAGE